MTDFIVAAAYCRYERMSALTRGIHKGRSVTITHIRQGHRHETLTKRAQ